VALTRRRLKSGDGEQRSGSSDPILARIERRACRWFAQSCREPWAFLRPYFLASSSGVYFFQREKVNTSLRPRKLEKFVRQYSHRQRRPPSLIFNPIQNGG